jgi:hypothetical protein
LLASLIVGELHHTDRGRHLGERLTVRHEHSNLPQLRENLFALLRFLRQSFTPTGLKTCLMADRFIGADH